MTLETSPCDPVPEDPNESLLTCMTRTIDATQARLDAQREALAALPDAVKNLTRGQCAVLNLYFF